MKKTLSFAKRVLVLALAAASPVLGTAAPVDVTTFHRNPQRTGWDDAEPSLTPKTVSSGAFGGVWESPAFDSLDGKPARLYASPLYVDRVRITAGEFSGQTFSVVFAASSNGFVYAVNASKAGSTLPGTILWRAQLGKPCYPGFDGLNMGVLSTPVIDLHRKVLYLATCEGHYAWKSYALHIGSGQPLPDWPVSIDAATLYRSGIAHNMEASGSTEAATRPSLGAQRGALNLSPDGSHLYVTFGESETGWLVAVDTVRPALVAAFASVSLPHNYAGGIWGAGGAAVDSSGLVFVATGTSFNGLKVQPHDWVQSVLALADSGSQGFVLRGTYTPFNYCATAATDIDLGSGGPSILPDLDPAATQTPHLLALVGKQGNVYLLNRTHLPGRLDQRPECSTDSSQDASLLPPGNQPQFGKSGPLNVFGPYTETSAAIDKARSRSVPAYFHSADGASYLFVTGNTKSDPDSATTVPPCLARLKIVTRPGRSAYLAVDQLEQTLVFENPGSPVVTSNGSKGAIVWVLDENARRTAGLDGTNSPRPTLYALDAMTLKLLWRTRADALYTSGKYNEPTTAHGTVFVGTDRIQAFGVHHE